MDKQFNEVFTLPVFPLPEVVLFPRVLLTLHIFEPRYQKLIGDLLALPKNDRLLIISNMNFQNLPNGENPFEVIGTIGKLIHVKKLDDGRSNIVLYGQFTANIEEIKPSPKPYRMCKINEILEEYWEEPLTPKLDEKERLIKAFSEFANRIKFPIENLSSIKVDDLINSLSSTLDIDGDRRQKLLEQVNLNRRLESLIDVLNEFGYYKKYIPKKEKYTDFN